jgi:outer membrane protein
VGGAGAGTIDGALIEAYRNNPQLNAQRAATRAIDENVPTALSGYRPRVTGTSSLTEQYLDTLTKAGSTPRDGALYNQQAGSVAVSSFGLTATQTLFNGFQTANRTRQAEQQVFSARETLRTTEQNTLLNAATAYMSLLQTSIGRGSSRYHYPADIARPRRRGDRITPLLLRLLTTGYGTKLPIRDAR